jgi:hypothetical protein
MPVALGLKLDPLAAVNWPNERMRFAYISKSRTQICSRASTDFSDVETNSQGVVAQRPRTLCQATQSGIAAVRLTRVFQRKAAQPCRKCSRCSLQRSDVGDGCCLRCRFGARVPSCRSRPLASR